MCDSTECKRCPFSKCMTDECVSHAQEIIFWRRPLKSLAVLVCIDLLFFLFYVLNTGFFATVILLFALPFLFSFIYRKFQQPISNFLFTPAIDANPSRKDRIRSLDEVKAFAGQYHNYVRQGIQWIENYRQTQTLNSHLIFFGASFVSFFVTTLFGTWLLCFLVVNAIMIVPAAFLQEDLHAFIRSKLNKPKKE